MATKQNTPGPWTRKSIPGHLFEIQDAAGDPVFRIRGGMMPTLEAAILIAAAPELAEALRGMVELCESPDFDGRPSNAVMIAARAALAKLEVQS